MNYRQTKQIQQQSTIGVRVEQRNETNSNSRISSDEERPSELLSTLNSFFSRKKKCKILNPVKP